MSREAASCRALVLTGAYGSGKSTVAEEIAELLGSREVPYAAIDLDWLRWSNVPGADHGEHALLGANLVAVVANYVAAGAQRFVLAGLIETAAEFEAIRVALSMPIAVVRLTAPLSVIGARLAASPTQARAGDLARAREWLERGTWPDLGETVVENDGDLGPVVERVLRAAGWWPLNRGPDP